MSKSSDLRWGLLGPGRIAGQLAEDLARTPGARRVAVASRDAGRAKDLAERQGIAKSYGGHACLAVDPEGDMVYVATHHSHHPADARMMREGGKPLLVEKPFAMNSAQTAGVFAWVRQRSLFVRDAMWTLCDPLFRQLASRIVSGDIGTPRAFSATIEPMGVPRRGRIENSGLADRFTLECMVYPVNILAGPALNLMTEAEVTAWALLTERGVDSRSSIHLTNADGFATMTGGLVVGAQGSGPCSFQLIDDGWLSITGTLFNPGRAVISAQGHEIQELIEPASLEHSRWEIEEAGRCPRENLCESSIVSHDLTLGVMRLPDQARTQARRRMPQ